MYRVCIRDEESITLWNCPTSMDVQGDQDNPLRKWNSYSYFHDFKQLWDGLLRRLDDMILVQVAAICYKLWTKRNCFVLNNTFNGPSTLLRSALADMEVYQDIHQCSRSNVDSMPQKVSNMRWSPPTDPSCKLNFDSTYDSQKRLMGIGIVVRNSRRRLRLWCMLQSCIFVLHSQQSVMLLWEVFNSVRR